MADVLTWLLKLEAQFDGASKMNVTLKEAEHELHNVEAAMKRTETATHSASDAAGGHAFHIKHVEDATKSATAAHGDHADAVKHVSDGYHKHAHETLGVGAALRETKGRAHEFLEAIGAVAAFEVMEKGIDIIKELGSEMLNAAAGAERLDKSFEMKLGVEGAKEALEYAEKIGKAETSEFTGKQMKGFENSLLQAGVSMKEMDKYMAAAADTASKAEDPIEGMGQAISALSRAAMSGNLDGRSLRRMFIGIPQLRELDEFKGKSDAQMKGIMSSGTLTLDQIFRVIAGKDHVLGDLAVKMSGTMSAQLNHLRALPEEFFEKLDHSKGYEHLKTKFADILKAFDPDGPQGSKIFSALESAFTSIADAATKIDFNHIGDILASDVIPVLGKIVKTLAEVDWKTGVEGMLTLLKAAAKITEGIWDAWQKAGDVALWLTGQSKGDQDRKKIQSAAEDNIPREIKKAAIAQLGELPDTPETAEIARQSYETTKSQRENRNRIKGMVPFVHFDEEKPTAGENYQEAMAKAMEDSEYHGPQEPHGRPGFKKKSAFHEEFALPDQPEQFPRPEQRADAAAASAVEGAKGGGWTMFEVGKDGGLGYSAGMRTTKPDSFAAGGELPESAAKGVQTTQESHSPSLLFRKFGRFGGMGYAEGLGDSEGLAEDAGRSVAEAALDGASDANGDDRVGKPIAFTAGRDVDQVPRQAAAPAAARPIEITINVNLGGVSAGKSASDHADELIAKLRAQMPGVFQGLAEQLAIEAGV
jgi:tape measure domain-containing protein